MKLKITTLGYKGLKFIEIIDNVDVKFVIGKCTYLIIRNNKPIAYYPISRTKIKTLTKSESYV